MKESNKQLVILSGLLLGIGGWISWLLFFWYMLIDGNPRGYYINPYIHNEFWFEFILYHIIVIGFILIIRLQWRAIFSYDKF